MPPAAAPWAPPRQAQPSPPGQPLAPIRYVPRPRVWAPAEETRVDRVTRTDLRLALAFLIAGFVVVFVNQLPLLLQIVLGAPVFEEFFKLGLALLPCAALRIRHLAVRLPLGLASGAGFGLLEHFLSYSDEPQFVLYGRVAFHAMAAGLSMIVLDGLSGSHRRLSLACTLPSTLVHGANNSAAVLVALASVAIGLDPESLVGLQVGAFFLAAMALAFVTAPLWLPGYRRLLERHLLPRLGPVGQSVTGPSTSSRS